MGDYRMTPAGRKAAEKGGTHYVGAEKSEEDVAKAADKARLQSTAGANLGSKGRPFTPPKMNPGESSATYSERVRKAREAHDEPPKAQALRNMMVGGK